MTEEMNRQISGLVLEGMDESDAHAWVCSSDVYKTLVRRVQNDPYFYETIFNCDSIDFMYWNESFTLLTIGGESRVLSTAEFMMEVMEVIEDACREHIMK